MRRRWRVTMLWTRWKSRAPACGLFGRFVTINSIRFNQPWMLIGNFWTWTGTSIRTRFGRRISGFMSSKNGRRRRNDRHCRPGRRLVVLMAAALLSSAVALTATDKLKELQAHFDRDTHAGAKIKDLQKLGAAEFDAATQAGRAGDFVAVGLILEKYRDNVRQAFELLRKQEPDADGHPGGYRQCELEVRQGIREVEDTLLVASEDVRPPLEIVRKDLIETDDALIHLLFPRRTKDPVKVAPAAEPKP